MRRMFAWMEPDFVRFCVALAATFVAIDGLSRGWL